MYKNTNGITLITLVITIIVLLILAGVSIAMLTGQNGILTQAQNAKTATEQASAKEKIELAVTGAMSKSRDGSLTIDNLKEELSNYGIAADKTEFPVEIELDGQKLAINNSGKVTNYKEMINITGQETVNTTTKDSLGNYIVVPAGFKIVNPTENVTDGIIIEDVSYEATAGSQFVWIPVGKVKKDDQGNIENVKLSRYTFDEQGKEADQGSKIIEYYYSEINTSPYGNTTAKENIESDKAGFRKSVKNNNGYYLGRYEARDKDTTEGRAETSAKTNQVVCTANNYIYNYVTQPEAATLSRTMYKDSNFESDLMNSYAWDTAIVFLQKLDNRSNKENMKPYSMQSSVSGNIIARKGTNNLEDISKQDVICNIWDMASNFLEWTTETSNCNDGECTFRGNSFTYPHYSPRGRHYLEKDSVYADDSFRPIIYIN